MSPYDPLGLDMGGRRQPTPMPSPKKPGQDWQAQFRERSRLEQGPTHTPLYRLFGYLVSLGLLLATGFFIWASLSMPWDK